MPTKTDKTDTITPPSAPFLGQAAPIEATPGIPDDIEDPITPASVLAPADTPAGAPLPPAVAEHAALLHGFCQALQGQLTQWVHQYTGAADQSLERVYQTCKDRVEAAGKTNEHALYQFASALATLQEQGVRIESLSNPYKATVEAVSPQGFPIMLEIVKRETGDLIQAVQGVTAWLVSEGFTVPQGLHA